MKFAPKRERSLGSVFTNFSREHSLFFSPRFCTFENDTTSDWLNGGQLEVLLLLNASIHRTTWRTRRKTFLRTVGEEDRH